MLSIYNVDDISTPTRSKFNESDLIVTGTIDDPIYILSDPKIDNKKTPSAHKEVHTEDVDRLDNSNNINDTENSNINNHDNSNNFNKDKNEDLDDDINDITHTPDNKYCNIIKSNSIASPAFNILEDNYYKHKFLLKLRKKQFENNFDIGLYFLIRYGGPNSKMGKLILNDRELIECSELIKYSNNHNELYQYYVYIYKLLYNKYINKYKSSSVNPSTAIEANKAVNGRNNLNKILCNILCSKKWFNKCKLYSKVMEQKNWNPFTIFGTSLPYININDIFNTSSNNDISGSGNQDSLNPNTSDSSNRDRLNIVDRINWYYDPLVYNEILWYLNATNKYIDKSSNVIIFQKCYCVTPNPNIRYNWNDPRNSVYRNYQGPRPSMGYILQYNEYNNIYNKYMNMKNKLYNKSKNGIKRRKTQENGLNGNNKTNGDEKRKDDKGYKDKRLENGDNIDMDISVDDIIVYNYYYNYFKHNQVLKNKLK